MMSDDGSGNHVTEAVKKVTLGDIIASKAISNGEVEDIEVEGDYHYPMKKNFPCACIMSPARFHSLDSAQLDVLRGVLDMDC